MFDVILCQIAIHICIILQLVKHLLYQRKQVPCSIDSIKKDLEVGMPPHSNHTDDPPTGGDPARAQEYLRRKRLAAKQLKTREKYLARAKTFVNNCQVGELIELEYTERLQYVTMCMASGLKIPV